MPKAYAVIVWNHFFGNFSRKSEPIETKSYGVTWHASLQTNSAEKIATFLSPKPCCFTTHFPADDFHEIWTRTVNWCGLESFQNRILKFFLKGVIYPEKPLFGFLWLQPWSLGLQWIWALYLIAEGPRLCLCGETFLYDLPSLRYRRGKVAPNVWSCVKVHYIDGSIYDKWPPNLKKIATKGFSTDFGSSELPWKHTKNLVKSNFGN